jgi:hypothetical protein
LNALIPPPMIAAEMSTIPAVTRTSFTVPPSAASVGPVDPYTSHLLAYGIRQARCHRRQQPGSPGAIFG